MASEYGTKEWWDEHRAGAYGGYKGGYSSSDDPYLGMSQDDIDRENYRRQSQLENQRLDKLRRQRQQEERDMLSNMTQEDRDNFLRQREEERRRREYYSGMTPEQRSRAYEREAELRNYEIAEEKRKREFAQKEEKMQAFAKAKSRYNRLNIFTKLKLAISGKSPNNISIQQVNQMDIDDINQLYGGRTR